MAQIRHELHEDVQGVVRGAEAATDWRKLVKNFPFATIGGAFLIGYLVIPHRKSSAKEWQSPPAGYEAPQQYHPQPVAAPAKKKRSWLKAGLGLVTPFALKAAQGYAMQYFEQFLAQKMAQNPALFPQGLQNFFPEGMMPQDPQAAQTPR